MMGQGMPQGMPNQQAAQMQKPNENSGGGVVQNVDEMIGALGEALSANPEAKQLADRMARVREEYRRIMEEAMSMQGGKVGMMNKANAGQPSQTQAMPERGMGTPQSPAGAY